MGKKASEHVAIVGAGVFGAWTAHHLLQAGHKVTLIDAWGPANTRASSGGESRLTRAAYGKDAIYTRMAMESLPQWKALSEVSGLPILIQCGILFFFPTEEPYVHDSIAAHRKWICRESHVFESRFRQSVLHQESFVVLCIEIQWVNGRQHVPQVAENDEGAQRWG